MKSFVSALTVAVALAIPAVSFAQTDAPLTRAQVRAQLVQLEQAGYNPNASDAYYPQDIQTAEARVNTTAVAQAPGQARDYGSVAAGTSQSGHAQSRSLGTFFGQ